MRRFAADWSRVVGVSLLAVSAGWTAVGLVHVWAYPLLGWLPLPVLALLAARACVQVTRRADLDAATVRFWRRMTLASVLFAAGIVANMYDAVGGSAPSQRIGSVTLACYMSVLFVVLWALLRLPSWQRRRSDWIRFGLDACVVLVTSSAFLWHFSLRDHSRWMT